MASLQCLQVVIIARNIHRLRGSLLFLPVMPVIALFQHVCLAATHVTVDVCHLYCTFLFDESQRIRTP